MVDVKKTAEDMAAPSSVSLPVDNRDKLKKNITVLRGIALVVGTVIGSGIFITPNAITKKVTAPATSMMIWLAGGVIAVSYTHLTLPTIYSV